MTDRVLPEVTPCVLFKRIVPHLKAAGWRITRGRGLEEDDRIYRPGCKAKGKFAERDQDFFLCYEEYGVNEALVSYVFDKGILTPEQIWAPHELAAINDAKESVSVTENEAAARTKPKPQKKKRKNETKEVKRKKKSTRSDDRVPIKNRDFGVELLQKTNQSMLECVTMVNRRWRELKGDLRDERIEWIPALAEEIEASLRDLKHEVWDVVIWARKSSSRSVPVPENFQLPYFRTWKDGLAELVENVEVYIQKLVVDVRRSRRLICGGNSEFQLHGGTQAYRSSTCEYLAIDIGKLQDDLSGALTEMLSMGGNDQACDSEKTDTDDE